MNEFNYHNLFETKGIEYIITIVFFLMLIPFWILLNRKEKSVQTAAAFEGILKPAFLSAPKGLFYSRNHTWAFLEKNGLARIGLDDLLVHLTGQVQVRLLKNVGENVSKGEQLAEIEKDGKKLKIVSPISGAVGRLNNVLNNDPGLLNVDPYGAGWLLQIEPDNWIAETQSFYMAEKAAEWLKTELSRFKDFVIQAVHVESFDNSQLVLQDGGELMDQTLKNLPAEVWQNFENDFLQLPSE